MSTSLPIRVLRKRPDLEQLKGQARELLDGYRAADPAAVAEVNAHYRDADARSFALHDMRACSRWRSGTTAATSSSFSSTRDWIRMSGQD